MVERIKPNISTEFLRRIVNQAKYLEGDLADYLFQFDLRQGMAVLELGSCIGQDCKKIAEAIYPGNVFSLDFNHNYVLYQKKHSGDIKGNIILIEADASSLPFSDDWCDFVYSRFLFQHLSDPRRVLFEIHRILRKGRKIVIVDTDDNYDTSFPELPLVKKAYTALAGLQHLMGGDRFIGKKLFTYLVDTGFRNVGIKVIPTLQYGRQNKEIVTKTIVPSFKEEYENIISKNLMEKEELDLAISELVTSVERKNSLHVGLIFIAFGAK